MDAAEDLVNWLDDSRAQHAELRADFAELRQELRATELRLDAKLETKLGTLKGELVSELGGQIGALAKELHAVDNKIERRFSDLILWSFVFWVGAVGAIALLARALRP